VRALYLTDYALVRLRLLPCRLLTYLPAIPYLPHTRPTPALRRLTAPNAALLQRSCAAGEAFRTRRNERGGRAADEGRK